MPIFSEQEKAHAWAELKNAGVRSRYGVDPKDAMVLLRYVMMAVKFALIVRPEFRELRLAALMYDTWKNSDPIHAVDAVWTEPTDPHVLCAGEHDPVYCPRRAAVLEVRQIAEEQADAVPPVPPATWDTPTDEQLIQLATGLKALP